MGAESGAVRWLALEEIDGISSSTHTLPPSVLAAYLGSEMGCEVALLGIQPANLGFDDPLSKEVEHSIQGVIVELAEILSTD